MGVHYQWDNVEKNIMLFTFDDSWTWSDYFIMKPISDKEIVSVEHDVVGIVEIPKRTPLEPTMLSQGGRVVNAMPSNLVMLILVTQNRLYQSMFNIFHKIYRGSKDSLMLVETMDAARELARKSLGKTQR